MPRVRTEEQLKLALDAPPRPEKKDAGGDKARWRELQRDWVATWSGRLLDEDVGDKAWLEWWRQSKTQHKALLQASRKENTSNSSADAADAPPAKVAAVRIPGLNYVTTAWLKRRVPEIVSLSVSEPEDLDAASGEQRQRVLTATVETSDGEEEREELLITYDHGDRREGSSNRAREECALLRLVKARREGEASVTVRTRPVSVFLCAPRDYDLSVREKRGPAT